MNVQDIRCFIAVAECGNFTEAALQLFVTQPAVSKQIRCLEKSLGIKLFDREGRRASLSEAGNRCLDAAYDIVFACDRFSRIASDEHALLSGALRIGYGNVTAMALLPPRINYLEKHHPALRVELQQSPFGRIRDMLYERLLDAIIIAQSAPLYEPWMAYRLLIPGRLALIVTDDHPLADHESVTFSQIEKEHFVLHGPEYSTYTYSSIMEECQRHGFTPNAVMLASNTDDIFMNVALGRGVGLMVQPLLDRNLGRLRAITVCDCTENFGIVLAWRRGDTNPALSALLQSFDETVQSTVDSECGADMHCVCKRNGETRK